MAPAGSFESLSAAIKAGANSIYFGIDKLNMRARSASPFTIADLYEISNICTDNNVKSYLALNTVIYDNEIDSVRSICQAVKESHISAIIASDLAVIRIARDLGVNVHISTQANISNFEAVKFYAQFADVMVLARELTLPQISRIVDSIKAQNIQGPGGKLVQIELFIHGALCVSISGKCYMSLANTNHSANRGDCLQTCRRKYRVTDDQTGEELTIDNQYVMSPKDLCTIRFMDKLIESGASVFKIEGRGRASDYVYRVTKTYKEAISAFFSGSFSEANFSNWEQELKSVYNRGFWHGGYYLGNKLGDWAGSHGSKATKQKKYVGYVKNYFKKSNIAQIIIEDQPVNIGDDIIATGKTTGYAETKIKSIFLDELSVQSATKGDDVTLPFEDTLRKNDKIYVYKDRDNILSP
jgi:U32 family peptidase